MKSDQWFTLWIAVSTVVGGGVVALLSVWAGASLALRGNRRAALEDRARLAAERCLLATDEAVEDYRHIRVITEESDVPLHEPLMESYDHLSKSEIGHEAWLLRNRDAAAELAACVRLSVQLHLDSFGSDRSTLLPMIADLSRRLASVGDVLRAELLGKRVSELTDREREMATTLLPGRHRPRG